LSRRKRRGSLTMSRHSLMWPRTALASAALAFAASLAALPGAARAQDGPKLYVGAIATQSDDTDKQAIDKARKQFAALKDAKEGDDIKKADAARAKAGRPPLFPTPEVPGPSPAPIAAAAALPQVGLGDGLLALSLLNLPAKKVAAAKDQLP